MTTAFEVKAVPTFRELNGRFVRVNQQLLEDRRDLVRELGKSYVELAGEEAPGGPGHTVANELGYRTFNDGEAVGFMLTTGRIAKFHVFGTGIYGARGRVIQPVRAAALHFFIDGQEFFRRSVRGIPRNAFPGRAYRRWLPGAQAGLARISTRFVRRLAGSET